MASDDTPPSEGPKPVERPNRERHREPPTIEGEAERLAEAPHAPTNEAAEAPAPAEDMAAPVDTFPPASEEPPVASPEPRRGQPVAMAAAVLALLISGGSAYYSWQRSQTPAEVVPPEVKAADIATLRSRLDQLTSRLDKIETATNRPVASPDQLAGLEGRVKSLEQRPVQDQPPSGPAPDLQALRSRLDAVEKLARQAATAAGERPAAPTPPRVDLTPLEDRIAKLESKAAEPPAPRVDLTPLQKRMDALEAQAAAPKIAARAKEDSTTVQRKGDPTALAVVAQALASAVESSRPYATEMAAADALGADPAQLGPLKALADKGAPSREALTRAFSQVSSKVLAAAEPAAHGDGFVDRLTASATRLVRVRPAGETAGEDAPSLVARIEAANARGDAPAALRDWTKLPQPAQAASSAYGDLLRKKVEAEKAARSIRDGAMSALARPKD